MQQADIKDNYFHENLKQYLSRILQHPTSNETSHETQGDLESEPTTQVQNANQLTEQQVRLHLFLPQGPENHLQAQKYQPKIWNNHIDPVNHTYTSQRQNPINYDTHQENRTNYNNSIITIQRLHFRKSSFQEYPNTTQSSNTFHYLNVQPSQGSVMYTISKSVFRENILAFSSTRIQRT